MSSIQTQHTTPLSWFNGITILDLTKVFSGPFATRMLADYGATVIKIESPDHPDDSRFYPPLKNNHSGYYEILNRNKKGITLNLKKEPDLKKFYELVKVADVIVENLTPPTKHRLAIDYETISKINDRIIYASLSGKGQDCNDKYYDILAQAESGLLSLSGSPDNPIKIGPSVVDAFTGMTTAFGIAGALLQREKAGKGSFIQISMLGSAMNLLESNLISYSVTKENPKRTGNIDNLISPFGVYKTANGFIAMAAGNEKQWQILSEFLSGHTSFQTDLFTSNQSRLERSTEVTALIESVFIKFDTSTLLPLLKGKGIAVAPVNQMSDVATHPDLFSQQALIRYHHTELGECIIPGLPIISSDFSFSVEPAPKVGEDNAEYGI